MKTSAEASGRQSETIDAMDAMFDELVTQPFRLTGSEGVRWGGEFSAMPVTMLRPHSELDLARLARIEARRPGLSVILVEHPVRGLPTDLRGGGGPVVLLETRPALLQVDVLAATRAGALLATLSPEVPGAVSGLDLRDALLRSLLLGTYLRSAGSVTGPGFLRYAPVEPAVAWTETSGASERLRVLTGDDFLPAFGGGRSGGSRLAAGFGRIAGVPLGLVAREDAVLVPARRGAALRLRLLASVCATAGLPLAVIGAPGELAAPLAALTESMIDSPRIVVVADATSAADGTSPQLPTLLPDSLRGWLHYQATVLGM